jgi:hypothetical protein
MCPWAALLDECICDDEFAHGGGDSDFGSFSVLPEVLVEGLDGRIDADGDDGSPFGAAQDKNVKRAARG